MGPDRRGFLRLVAGALALLSTGAGSRRESPSAQAIHAATRAPQPKRRGRPAPGSEAEPLRSQPGAERIGLPPLASAAEVSLARAVRRYAPATGFRAAELPLAQLGRALYLANGMTGREPGRRRSHDHRAAPSAGALYGGELYVLAERVRGLAPGAYHYDVHDHALVRLRAGSSRGEVARALERPAVVENAAAVVLITNVFARYMGKYALRGYRYALLDTGHIAENLRLALASAALGETAPLRFWDDRLHELIGVDGREEAVCALHVIGIPGDDGPEADAAAPRRRLVERQHAEAAGVSRTAGPAERYHQATKLVPGEGAPPAGDPSRRRSRPGASGLTLPRSEPPPEGAVERAIRRRCSAERFAPRSVSPAELGFVLEMARGHAALERAPGVDLHLAVHAVEGLPRGLYRYEPQSHGLVAIREGDLRAALSVACLGQERAGTAAVGFLMLARIEEASARGGDRSYRDLLIEAGAIGQRVYLAAGVLGLGARNLSAFDDDALNRLLGWDGRREAVVHLTLLGRRR